MTALDELIQKRYEKIPKNTKFKELYPYHPTVGFGERRDLINIADTLAEVYVVNGKEIFGFLKELDDYGDSGGYSGLEGVKKRLFSIVRRRGVDVEKEIVVVPQGERAITFEQYVSSVTYRFLLLFLFELERELDVSQKGELDVSQEGELDVNKVIDIDEDEALNFDSVADDKDEQLKDEQLKVYDDLAHKIIQIWNTDKLKNEQEQWAHNCIDKIKYLQRGAEKSKFTQHLLHAENSSATCNDRLY